MFSGPQRALQWSAVSQSSREAATMWTVGCGSFRVKISTRVESMSLAERLILTFIGDGLVLLRHNFGSGWFLVRKRARNSDTRCSLGTVV